MIRARRILFGSDNFNVQRLRPVVLVLEREGQTRCIGEIKAGDITAEELFLNNHSPVVQPWDSDAIIWSLMSVSQH